MSAVLYTDSCTLIDCAYQNVLEKAVELYRRQRFLEESNRAFAALRADPKKWKAEQQEREDWDATIADDLTEEQAMPEPSRGDGGLVNSGPTRGHERSGITIVAKGIPLHVEIDPPEAGVKVKREDRIRILLGL